MEALFIGLLFAYVMLFNVVGTLVSNSRPEDCPVNTSATLFVSNPHKGVKVVAGSARIFSFTPNALEKTLWYHRTHNSYRRKGVMPWLERDWDGDCYDWNDTYLNVEGRSSWEGYDEDDYDVCIFRPFRGKRAFEDGMHDLSFAADPCEEDLWLYAIGEIDTGEFNTRVTGRVWAGRDDRGDYVLPNVYVYNWRKWHYATRFSLVWEHTATLEGWAPMCENKAALSLVQHRAVTNAHKMVLRSTGRSTYYQGAGREVRYGEWVNEWEAAPYPVFNPVFDWATGHYIEAWRDAETVFETRMIPTPAPDMTVWEQKDEETNPFAPAHTVWHADTRRVNKAALRGVTGFKNHRFNGEKQPHPRPLIGEHNESRGEISRDWKKERQLTKRALEAGEDADFFFVGLDY